MDSLQALTAGLIDYAGLFPPAELGMRAALENYSGYLAGTDATSLGRFIVPANRLDELEIAAAQALPLIGSSVPWRLSALLTDPGNDIARVRRFNAGHADSPGSWRAVIDAVECKVGSPAEIGATRAGIPASITPYFELPVDDALEESVSEVKGAGARAKLRTGGVTPAAFPASAGILRFMRACLGAGVAFKTTAGLHHPVRAVYPLTYRPNSDTTMMFGFLNMFLGAVLLRTGADDVRVSALLEETETSAFRFSDRGAEWRGDLLSTADISETRHSFAVSFGSCSFREPIDELRLLPAGAMVA